MKEDKTDNVLVFLIMFLFLIAFGYSALRDYNTFNVKKEVVYEPIVQTITHIEKEYVWGGGAADEIELIPLGDMLITGYCNCTKCCGKYAGKGITASGTKATANRTVATSNKWAFGTRLLIDGQEYVVEDRGMGSDNWVDIYCNTHDEAKAVGYGKKEVYLIKEN